MTRLNEQLFVALFLILIGSTAQAARPCVLSAEDERQLSALHEAVPTVRLSDGDKSVDQDDLQIQTFSAWSAEVGTVINQRRYCLEMQPPGTSQESNVRELERQEAILQQFNDALTKMKNAQATRRQQAQERDRQAQEREREEQEHEREVQAEQKEIDDAKLQTPENAAISVSAAFCILTDARKKASDEIANERKYSRVGGVQNSAKLYFLQKIIRKCDDGFGQLKGILKTSKSKLIKCSDQRVASTRECFEKTDSQEPICAPMRDWRSQIYDWMGDPPNIWGFQCLTTVNGVCQPEY